MTINSGIPRAFVDNFIGFWISSLPGVTLPIVTITALSAALVAALTGFCTTVLTKSAPKAGVAIL